MLKKILLIVSSLIFGLGVLAFSVYQTSVQAVAENLAAQSMEFNVGGSEATKEGAEEKGIKVDYALTWPGILPDHFLYPVKMIRDKIWLFLTSDLLKKAELQLKMADKRIWSAQMLAEKKKYELGVTTATKAEKYLEQSFNEVKKAETEGKDTMTLLENLAKASQKHEEILLEMREKVPEDAKVVVENALAYPRQILEEVESLKDK